MSFSFSNVVCVSKSDPHNQGNRASSPRRYWPWVAHFPSYDLESVRPIEVRNRSVIIGGGGILDYTYKSQLDMIAEEAKEVFLWGVGLNTAGDTPDLSPLDWKIVSEAKLFGTRDALQRDDAWHTGCPSVMHPFFSLPITPEIAPVHPVCAYFHPDHAIQLPGNIPTLTTQVPMDEALFHLSSAQCVVTTSYHGALWASWMGREVIVPIVHSSKFVTGLEPSTIKFGSPAPTFEFNEAGRRAYETVLREHRAWEKLIGSAISIEPVC